MNELDLFGVLILKHFLPVGESELFALLLEDSSQGWVAAIEHSDVTLVLILEILEEFVPVGTASLGAGLQTGDKIPLFLEEKNHCKICAQLFQEKIIKLYLLMKKIQSKLESQCPHVTLLQS